MKTKIQFLFVALILVQVLLFQYSSADAQGTTFTYQGQLTDNGSPANGTNYGVLFNLYDAATGGSSLGNLGIVSVAVSNGLFTVPLDFGASVFDGSSRWLDIGVQKNGGVFTTLSPRQRLTPAPYAIFAETIGAGSGIPRTNQVWLIDGNPGTSSDFIGTTDNQPFDIRVNNVRAMRFQLNTNTGSVWTNAPNIVGGSSVNLASPAAVGATIAGGGGIDSPAGGTVSANTVTSDFGTVGGGLGNTAGFDATISGGFNNNASGFYTTISGGYANMASANYAAVSGGNQNTASSVQATVAGGYHNTAGGSDATVCGGYHNNASGNYATVGGGNQNIASGDYSFAGGNYAHAQHDGSFVWSDATSPVPFPSTSANQFRVRATGGAAFATAIDVNGTVSAGVHVLSGDTAWSSISDRNAKKNFQPVNGEGILEKLAAMPVQFWNYKWEGDTNTPHIGPMAQDFKAAFYPGRNDKSISTLEFDGVELAAIQGLNQKLEEQIKIQNARMKDKEAEIQELKQRLDRLEKSLER